MDLFKLYSSEWKIEEAYKDVVEGRLSVSSRLPIILSILSRGKYRVLDGPHRVIEAIMAGKKSLDWELDVFLPSLKVAGPGYQCYIDDAISIVDKVNELMA